MEYLLISFIVGDYGSCWWKVLFIFIFLIEMVNIIVDGKKDVFGGFCLVECLLNGM